MQIVNCPQRIGDFIQRIEKTFDSVHRFAVGMGIKIKYPKEKLPVVFCATFEEFSARSAQIVGTPDQCMKKIQHYAEIGVDQLLCYVQFGYLPHESVMRTIELLGTEIIPELEKQGHEAEATVAAR